MNVKEKIQTVLQKLKLFDKAKANTLTNEDWQSIVNSYQQEYKVTLQDDMAAEQAAQQNPLDQDALNQAQAILAGIVSGVSTSEDQESSDTQQENPKAPESSSTPATPETLVKLTQTVSDLVSTMKSQAAADIPLSEARVSTIGFMGPASTSKYLFGVENSMFSMDYRWNKITANPRAASSLDDADEETDGVTFRKQAVAYSRSLQKRYNYLHANSMLDPKRLAAGEFVTNYEGVNTAGVGNQQIGRAHV